VLGSSIGELEYIDLVSGIFRVEEIKRR